MTTEAVRKSMQGNKRANTKPELRLRQMLRDVGLTGYRLQWKVPGHPDVCWPGHKVALFIHGCFWHRCPRCDLALPKSNVEYWQAKFERNVERDQQVAEQLEAAGWTVHVIWECDLKKDNIGLVADVLFPLLAYELGKELRESGAATAPNRKNASLAAPTDGLEPRKGR